MYNGRLLEEWIPTSALPERNLKQMKKKNARIMKWKAKSVGNLHDEF